MWLSAVKLALNAGTHIYKKKQETKMLMADAQANHAAKMAQGQLEYSGKLLEARQNDYKDEVVLAILTLPILVLAYGVWFGDESSMDKINLFFEPSTRTLSSFDLAGKRLGADVMSMNMGNSALKKGETLIDTAMTLNAMHPDIIVIRHQDSGAPNLLSQKVN